MNVLTVAGRLTADAVVRHTADGKAVSGFTVATDVGYGDNKHPLFVRCSDWRKPAEKLAEYLTKGKPVTVSGECDLRSYEHEGEKRTNLELNVREIELQGGKSGNQSGDKPAESQGFREQRQESRSDSFDQDDIPFSGEAA